MSNLNNKKIPNDKDLLETFRPASEIKETEDVGEFSEEEVKRLRQSGIDLSSSGRAGSFMQTLLSRGLIAMPRA
ncbi:MAG: hypothetical protein GWP10_03315 [Nitrospiraceae bacterium]|nr:hypothetical protein [Nitrospiraceae bacterium]